MKNNVNSLHLGTPLQTSTRPVRSDVIHHEQVGGNQQVQVCRNSRGQTTTRVFTYGQVG